MTADEVKRLRRTLRLTQEQFAKRIGVTGNTIARWERGEAQMQPANDRLVRLTVALMHPVVKPTPRKKVKKKVTRKVK